MPAIAPTPARKNHGVFYYVFFGVLSLIATVFILFIGSAMLAGCIEGFNRGLENSRSLSK
ncbi:MAG: hypothetical protein JNL10_03150 [Verrucomicrobiales bacterium]|nr:hypothetical protein [Verrucomicrobiales bacterium]